MIERKEAKEKDRKTLNKKTRSTTAETSTNQQQQQKYPNDWAIYGITSACAYKRVKKGLINK